jgi:hypothetical protein
VAVDTLKKLMKQFSLAMETAYQGTTHKTPKTDHLVHHVVRKVQDERLHLFTEDWPRNAKAKAVLNILFAGEANLTSSTLNAFNRKVQAIVRGQQYAEEMDLLPQVDLAL